MKMQFVFCSISALLFYFAWGRVSLKSHFYLRLTYKFSALSLFMSLMALFCSCLEHISEYLKLSELAQDATHRPFKPKFERNLFDNTRKWSKSSRKYRKVKRIAAVEPQQFCHCPKPRPCLFMPRLSPEALAFEDRPETFSPQWWVWTVNEKHWSPYTQEIARKLLWVKEFTTISGHSYLNWWEIN